MQGIFKRAYDAKWVIFGVALVLLLLWVAWPFLAVIVYSIFIYYIARPMKRRLRPYIKSDSLLVAACMFLLVLPLLIIIGYTLLVALSQFNSLVAGTGLQTLPQGPLSNLSMAVAQHNLTIEKILSGDFSVPENWYGVLPGYGGSIASLQHFLVAAGGTVVDVIFKLFLMFAIAFYLIRDDERIKSWVASTFPDMMQEHGGVLVKYFKAVDGDLEKIFFGNVLSIVFFAIVAAIVFSALNVFAPPSMRIPSPILMGILCGVSALVPVVGMYLVTVPLFLYILIGSLAAGTLIANISYYIFMALAVLLLVQTLPEIFIRPFIASGQVNTGLLMFAYILGPVVFGIAGLFIGAIVLVLLTHYFRIVVPSLAGHQGYK